MSHGTDKAVYEQNKNFFEAWLAPLKNKAQPRFSFLDSYLKGECNVVYTASVQFELIFKSDYLQISELNEQKDVLDYIQFSFL